ncbi:MAG: DUF2927 domain-containing protein [Dongiaceae bacterium]
MNALIRLFFLLAALVVAPVSASPAAAQADDGTLSNEQILANLIEVIFGSEFVGEEVDFVRKWQGPLRIAIYAREPERYRGIVRPYLEHLGRLTGLDIALVPSQSEGENAHILILGREQFYAYADANLGAGKNPRTNSFLACFGFFRAGDSGRISEATAVMPSYISDEEMRSCVVEEVTQVIGLPNDSFEIAPSIFNDDDAYRYLTWQDELFLQVLYDSRIEPGMSRVDFEALARQIIDERRPED